MEASIGQLENMAVVLKIGDPFGLLIIKQHRIFRGTKKGPNFGTTHGTPTLPLIHFSVDSAGPGGRHVYIKGI